MSITRIIFTATTLVMLLTAFFIYPSTDKSVNAGQSKSRQDVTAFTKVQRISVSSDAVLTHYFGKDVVEKTMKQPGCVGVRMYYGKHANGKSGFVIVGVDKNGRDMESTILAGPIIICPPWCGN